MKFTVVLVTIFSISWAVKVQNSDDPKDKREAPVGYPAGGHSSHSFQAPSYGHEGANAISIGAGYSVGGAKPSFSYGAPESGAGLQLSSESLPSSGHATIQLAPITLQPSHGNIVSGDLAQLMSQLSHGLNTGALSLSPYQTSDQSLHGSQEVAIPQYSFGDGKLQQYSAPEQHGISSVPSYAAGTKGLGSYGSTGPVLFQPSESHSSQPALTYGAPNGGHSFGEAGGLSIGSGHSLAGLTLGDSGHALAGFGQSLGSHSLGEGGLTLGGSGHSLGGSGHSLGGSGGHSLGGSGHSLGSSGHSLGGSGHSLGGSGHSLGGLGHVYGGSIKSFGGGYVVPSKASFKPSTYIGTHGDSIHGLSASHGVPSFGSHSLSGGHGGLSLGSSGHGVSFGNYVGGSSKHVAPSYLPPKSKGFGGALDSVAYSSSHASPPRTTYGVPTSSYSGSSGVSSHAAASHSPEYYVSSSKFPSFGEGSSSFKGPSGHSALSSFSSGPKYSFSHSPSARYGAPKDIHGSFSENSYNTIKYSEELKPRAH
ncbi:fibroin heavy chain-like [Pectinophora gossypiella]|uniref:fibroin heavy chain-like n=1 Tax=Pectinophora gossypiella TaxID=13191 RepID=UPI00214F5692|nr:fibroin heavy chain-like [Pectinophora gossypiella]